MSIADLCCDLCGRVVAGPAEGVRFVFHPGVPDLRDDSGLACQDCWRHALAGLDVTAVARCAACGEPVSRQRSLHLRPFDEPGFFRLCASHAVIFLNALRTVQPKLDAATFRFPADGMDENRPGGG